MDDGIEITISDFKRYNTKEQNVVIFKNLLEVKRDVRKFQVTNIEEHRKMKGLSLKSILISSGAITLAVILMGYLFQHVSNTVQP